MILSDKELVNGLSGARLQLALESIEDKGFVVLERCIDKDFVKILHSELMLAFEEKRKKLNLEPSPHHSLIDYAGIGGNHGFNRWNIRLPSRRPFLDDRLIANPASLPIIRALFGASANMGIMACDMNLPKSTIQGLHRDRESFALIINIPLVDMTIENGATQVFPGTHKLPNHAFDMNGPLPEVPSWPPRTWESEFLCVPAGSIIIRDVRVAHRGMVNSTNEPRPLININVDSPKHNFVPHHWMTSLVEKWGRSERSYRLKERTTDTLSFWNGWGQMVTQQAKSDRFDKRRIPFAEWNQLGQDARQLLRYAEVENFKSDAYRSEKSLRHLLALPLLMKNAYQHRRSKKISESQSTYPKGIVDPHDLPLLSALRKNMHCDEDDQILINAMRLLGEDI